MSKIHEDLIDLGREQLIHKAVSRRDRQLIEIAAETMGDDGQGEVFSHPALCLTFLPHRQRPADEIWERTSGPWTLTVQPLQRGGGRLGVPHGPKARLILLFLQTEAVLSGSRIIELGRSMRSWLTHMGVAIGGKNYQEVRRQAQKIEQAHFTVTYAGERGMATWQDTIIRGSFLPDAEREEIHTIELSESFFQAAIKKPVPLADAAIRALGQRCMALDIYLWLAYRLHFLDAPLDVSWIALHAQFAGEIQSMRHFRQPFRHELEAALAAYPDAKVETTERGVRLYPSRSPVRRASPRVSLICRKVSNPDLII
jgi:hypothetical protein